MEASIFAKLVAMRSFNDKDCRAIEKTMRELEARLPVKFEAPADLTKLLDLRGLRRHQVTKKQYTQQEFKPKICNMGDETNVALPREEPEEVAEA